MTSASKFKKSGQPEMKLHYTVVSAAELLADGFMWVLRSC